MNLIELQKVNDLTCEYDSVITKIKDIDAMAKAILHDDENTTVSFTMKVENVNSEIESDKSSYDEIIVNSPSRLIRLSDISFNCDECMAKREKTNPKVKTNELSRDVKDLVGLRMLGILLEIEHTKEKEILHELKKMGVEI